MKKINIRLLRKVQAAILRKPRQFQMAMLFSGRDSMGKPATGCGTAACVAGWAIFLAKRAKRLEDIRWPHSELTVATKALGLSNHQSCILFDDANWPTPFKDKYWSAKTAQGKARVAAKRIEHFIKTKGAD